MPRTHPTVACDRCGRTVAARLLDKHQAGSHCGGNVDLKRAVLACSCGWTVPLSADQPGRQMHRHALTVHARRPVAAELVPTLPEQVAS